MVHTNCSVYGCNSTSTKNKDLKFHRFPPDARCQLWIVACERPDLKDKNYEQLKNMHVFSMHFERWMYMKRKLKSSAIPVLHLPSASSLPMSTEPEAKKIEAIKDLHGRDVRPQAVFAPLQTTLKLVEHTSNKSNELHEGFTCNSCSGKIIGYRYTCVQCANYDLCDSCEVKGEHSHHYVLRIPKPAPFAEINAVLSKIRTQLLYGLDNDAVAEPEEAREPQPGMAEEAIKVEVKEELPDPLEHEDAFQTDDNYTETDTIELSAPKENTTAIVPNVKTSTLTLTESGGNLFIIENPISVAQTVPTISKKHKTASASTQVTKRIKVEPQETGVTCEFMEVPINVTAGSSTEGGSGELLRKVLTTKKADEDGSFQVFSHTEKNPVEAKPGPAKGTGKKTAAATTKKKKSDANTLNK